MDNKLYQVFVSSTYSDLKDERRRVSDFLAKDGFVPAGMELFPATDQQQLEFIKRIIDRCDYYIVIVGGRYGSLADDNVSFTEKEYEYAIAKRMPVLAFLHGEPDSIELGKTDKDAAKALKLQAFRDRLSTGRMVDYWKDAYELCAKVVIAVGQASTLYPGVGWVRGDQAIDPKIIQELEQQRTQNAELKKQLEQMNSGALAFPPNLPSPDSEIELKVYAGDNSYSPQLAQYKLKYSMTWSEIFISSIDLILKEESEYSIASNLASHLLLKGNTGLQTASLDAHDFKQVRIQLEALGLIRATARKPINSAGSSYSITVWEITEKGRRFMSERLALQKQRSTD